MRGLASNEVVVEHQKRSSLLVNPRKKQEFTKYSFPSKVLEYMSSGTPMLAYRLDGIPTEYDPFYYQIREDSDGLKKSLEFVISLPENIRLDLGKKAREYVFAYKNPKKQCKKVVELLNI